MNQFDTLNKKTIFLRIRNRFTSSTKSLSSENEINKLEKKNKQTSNNLNNDLHRNQIASGFIYYNSKKRSLSLRLRKSLTLNNNKKFEFLKQNEPIITICPFSNNIFVEKNKNEKVCFFFKLIIIKDFFL